MIYIHIPFCKQACHYCDFHFSTNLKQKQAFLFALNQEIELQRAFFESAVFPSQNSETSSLLASPRATNKKIKTIYFGGGTPSILEISELKSILEKIKSTFEIDENAEITLEANPDDLTSLDFLKQLREIGFNRLSIGIQSFEESFLKFMNRAHNANEAKNCVKLAQKAGFENISVDLIYGVKLPSVNDFENQSEELSQNLVSNPHYFWKKDLAFALSLNVPHISAYCLTIEPKTQFGNSLKRGKIKPIDEEFAAQQFEILTQTLKENGYIHYEISNFAKPNQFSKHNTAYWQDEPYLGLGASAHSYDGKNRFMNAANNRKYTESLSKDNLPQIIDELSENDRINEYFLTSLRTIWGTDLNHLITKYNYNLLENQSKTVSRLIDNKMILIENDKIILTETGKLFADGIASDLFV
ncbi:putative oxygen-independent coproporphyrinogen III oxidase [Bernardetia litoralis DSM 6794]|uniref:Heme chaperone HemW n=1 Tax=Bernardetia litoralis (strain ATCC 23117 / DSM 6794 / NBRC 15988 / NCIMB 1366 / Fx l1 / Sio-4) TaxID=880071 RepID=I4AN08_BERLS|nr:radical SAM family heme chaperone HemW [Bernardetia litoralis]AFM05343.1 putative oxygen-independent coproporphyrinogen III oxidase [Bernardetia litoralis DSM 6794]